MQYLHTMIRVGNLENAIKFYCEVLNFTEESRQEHPEGKFTLVFLRAPGDTKGGPTLELTYNWGVSKYEMGGAYGHTAYKVTSLAAIQERLKKSGLDFSWGPSKTPSGNRGMAFVTDPDGYKIELLEYKE